MYIRDSEWLIDSFALKRDKWSFLSPVYTFTIFGYGAATIRHVL